MMNRKGFTLIELLIVVVIIGILAAIAIPKFANTKEKAVVASMKSDLRNLVTAQEGFFSDNQDLRRPRIATPQPTAPAVRGKVAFGPSASNVLVGRLRHAGWLVGDGHQPGRHQRVPRRVRHLRRRPATYSPAGRRSRPRAPRSATKPAAEG